RQDARPTFDAVEGARGKREAYEANVDHLGHTLRIALLEFGDEGVVLRFSRVVLLNPLSFLLGADNPLVTGSGGAGHERLLSAGSSGGVGATMSASGGRRHTGCEREVRV